MLNLGVAFMNGNSTCMNLANFSPQPHDWTLFLQLSLYFVDSPQVLRRPAPLERAGRASMLRGNVTQRLHAALMLLVFIKG